MEGKRTRVATGAHASGQRGRLPFRAVNRRDAAGYDPGLQRHHLLPCQLLHRRCFGTMFDAIGRHRIGFDDFRANGLLLPAETRAALRMGLPLHRGPHRSYNALVMERVGQIEARWATARRASPDPAREEALMRLGLLQRALRRRLLQPHGRRMALSRRDPAFDQIDFAELDAMADMLWGATGS